jgi:fluoride exporter
MKTVLVGAAGAVGALARYGIGVAVGVRVFPWATLGINVVGAFLLGLVLTVTNERGMSHLVSVPLAVGFLGAFTTWSTFSWETFAMLRTGQEAKAVVYVLASLVVSLLATLAGYRAGQALA